MSRKTIDILKELYHERKKYTKANKDLIEQLVDELIGNGVYPKFGCREQYTALEMVESWGVEWHQFSAPHFCPECGSDLRKWEDGPPFKRETWSKSGHVVCAILKCPDCKEDITQAITKVSRKPAYF